MSNPDRAADENPVLVAYRAVREGRDSASSDLIADYRRYFVTPSLVSVERTATFERFSLIDPNVRTVIQSSTTTR